MNTRRKFLIQGSLASTAMLALKPLNAVARITSSFTGAGYSKLIFLHTANADAGNTSHIIEYVKSKKKNTGAILLSAGEQIHNLPIQKACGASAGIANDIHEKTDDYTIIDKGRLRTGVIRINPGEINIIQKVNSLSAYLKNKKNCTLVVCISTLGYKNSNAPNDFNLAAASTHLDIIIGGHSKNFYPHPYIVSNKNKQEVVIHSASGLVDTCGIIDIDFDEQGAKKQISFTA